MGPCGGSIDKFPMGSVMNRSLTIRSGQCYVQRYMKPLLKRVQKGEIDPSFVITHRLPLDEDPEDRVPNAPTAAVGAFVVRPDRST